MTCEVLQNPDYPVHPAADEFPMLDEKRLNELAADIAQNGLLEPIELFDGQILDGRNRLKACAQAGVAPKFTTVDCDNPWWYVWSKNGQRRDLPDLTRGTSFAGCQVGAVAYEQARVEAEERRVSAMTETKKQHAIDRAEENTKIEQHGRKSSARVVAAECTDQPPKRQRNEENRTTHALAQKAGVSRAVMEKVLAIKHHDEQHGTNFVAQIKAGAIKPTKASTEVRKANLAAKVKAQIEQAPTRPIIKQQDAIAFLSELADHSADLLLTDPPYSTDVEDLDAFIASWLPLALTKIKPTGRAYICVGAYPDELHAYLNALAQQDRMMLANVLVWTYRNTLGPAPKTDYKLNWQAILYLRGPDVAALDCPVMTEQFSVLDINAPDGRQGDRYHAWQKPLEIGERFIRHATKPGDLVIDPFACTGTFLLAAAQLGRTAIGCDVSDEAIDIATARGCVQATLEVCDAD